MALVTAFKPFIIALLDGLEYRFFNPMVFQVHNFPGIVPNMKPGIWAAMVSGFKCSWFLYWPLTIFYYWCNFDQSFLVFNSSLTFLTFGYCITRMIINPSPKNIYEHHVRFYSGFAFVEFMSLIYLGLKTLALV